MTVRARLTLWYAGMLFVSVLLIGGVAHREFVAEQRSQAAEPDPSESVMDDLLEIALWFGLPAAVLGLAGGWFLMRRAMAPLTALTAAAGRVTEHHLRSALPRSGNGDELDRLTDVFNAMIARLDGSFQRIREFTLHASHELKTPLTVLHGELEAALQDGGLPARQRERCATQLLEVQRLVQIVDGLALLTRADAGQVRLARDRVPLDELVRDAFEDARILGRSQRLEVTLEVCEALSVSGDRNRLRQLLLNLTDNAVKYNAADGRVLFSLRREGSMAALTVCNSGPGVPADLQDRVFERFFRCNAGRAGTDADGCGLGLSIARWIVSAHGGTLALRSEPGGLTTATVRLPISPSTAGQESR